MQQTVDVDVRVTAEVAECLLACGSSFFCPAVAVAAMAASAADAAVAAMIAVCGLSYSLFSAAASAEIVVEAVTAAETTADADANTLKQPRCIFMYRGYFLYHRWLF